ncbi:MAG: polyphosphate polymerase domain-containing protein [Aristaeellaceae bacterium]
MEHAKRVYRHEWKYLISYPEAELLQRRLSPYLALDQNARQNGEYMIRSLYFDDMHDSAYREKIMGVDFRQKWRIRVYNCSDRHISLERKTKTGSYIYKESASLTREDFERILDGDYSVLLRKHNGLCNEFYYECMVKLMRPKVIVDYDRTPLVMDAGTVRITFDKCVRAAIGSLDIFDAQLPTLPAIAPGKLVLEVKYTAFLPQVIKTLLPLNGQEFSAFSKYAECYEAAHHLTDPTAGISKTHLVRRKNEDVYSGLF